MTTANPYVCSDVASSNDVSVPYCDSEDDTEYHNGLGSDALIDDIHLDGPFDEEMRRLHKSELDAKKHSHTNYHSWKKENKKNIQIMREAHHKKHHETQKENNTDAGKKGSKKNKHNKGHEKMSKFESEFATLYNTWSIMTYNIYHNAWVESRGIVAMQEGEIKQNMTIEYVKKYEISSEIRNYLTDGSTVFTPISQKDKISNLIARIKTLSENKEAAEIDKSEISLSKTRTNIASLTGGK